MYYHYFEMTPAFKLAVDGILEMWVSKLWETVNLLEDILIDSVLLTSK